VPFDPFATLNIFSPDVNICDSLTQTFQSFTPIAIPIMLVLDILAVHIIATG
jgi:hypothetical protein